MVLPHALSVAARSAVLICFPCFLCCSCDNYSMHEGIDPKLEKAGDVLNKLQQAQAEFGTMSISTPVLATPDSAFQFNIASTADTFYKDARTSRQGGAFESQQQLFDFEE